MIEEAEAIMVKVPIARLIVVMGQEIVTGWLAHNRRNKTTLPDDIDSPAEG